MKRHHKFILLATTFTLGLGLGSCSKDKEISINGGGGSGDKITYTITDYGADATGKDDCSEAFEALMKEMSDKGHKQVDVFLPAGKYRIGKRVNFNQAIFAGYSDNAGIIFRGAGEDVTELICDNYDGGFAFNAGTNLITVTVCDMSFVTSRKGEGTAVEFNTANQNAGDHHSRMFQARNLLIRGNSFSEGYFENGVVVKNAWYPMLENVKITNEYGGSTARMNEGFLLENCYSPLLDKCYFWGGANYGLRYVSTIDSEDGIVSDSYFVGQDVGVYVSLSARTDGWGEPAFHLSGCHIHYNKKGLALKGTRQGFVSQNLFYCFNLAGSKWRNDTNAVTSYESKDIELDCANDYIISNNQFTEPASPKRVCIDILATSGNILIDSNIFNMDGTAIRNQSVQISRCIGNVFHGNPDFTRANGGQGAVALVRYVDPKGTLENDNDFSRATN